MLVLSGVVYFAAPRRTANRLLAALLFLEGAAFIYGGGIESLLLPEAPRHYAALVGMHVMNMVAWGVAGTALYLLFLGVALDTPLVAPLRTPLGRAAIGAGAVATTAYFMAHPEGAWVPHPTFGGVHGDLFVRLFVGIAIVSSYAIVAAVSAWRRAPKGSEKRRRLGLFVIAFGVRDASIVGIEAIDRLVLQEGLNQSIAVLPVAAFFVADLGFPVFLTYGILKAQLFDIDLKLKWTVRRGTLVAVFVAVAVAAFAVVEQWLEQYG
ncbi:MAG: hypothetical protein ACT4PT_12150, partial [Methanobacteriota archaeon]